MRLTEKVHQLLAGQVRAGDLTIDATAGNGHDTVFLAETVGEQGTVIAIDIQASALHSTEEKLISKGLAQRVTLYCADHAEQLQTLQEKHTGRVASILFNLGYLPGSDQSITTQPASTEKALAAALNLLSPGGLLCVTAYRGHPGGAEEAQTVANWMQTQAQAGQSIQCHEPKANTIPPILWVLQKA